MKFLTIFVTISALAVCKDAVRPQETTTIDQIKLRARQVHKDLDQNKDGHVSLAQISTGIKKGVGLLNEEIGSSEPSYTHRFYEKFISGKKNKSDYLTEDDFEELFSSFGRSKGKKGSKQQQQEDDQSSLFQRIKQKANELYEKIDQNKDGSVTIDELTKGLKSGLGFSDDEDEDQDQKKDSKKNSKKKPQRDEKSLKQYAQKLYSKYAKKDNKKGVFTRQSFYQIINQERQQTFLEKAKSKASELYNSLNANKDKYLSLQEFSKGIKQFLNIQDNSSEDEQKSLKQKANQLYEKYVKSDKKDSKGFTLEDVQDLVITKMKEAKKKGIKNAKKIKQSVEDLIDDTSDQVSKKASEAKNKAEKVVKNSKGQVEDVVKNAGKKASQAKQTIQETAEKIADQVSDQASKLKKKASRVVQGAQDTLKETGQTLSDKVSELKDSASQVVDKISQHASNLIDQGSEIIDNVADKASQIKDSIKNKVSSTAQQASDSIKDEFNEWKESGEQSIQQLKEKAQQIYSKFDKNGDNSLTFEELKQAIRSGLGLENEKDEEQEKGYIQRLTEVYKKYTKSDKGKASVSKDDFFNIFSSEKRYRDKKSFLQKTKQQADKLFSDFDNDKDGHVSLEEIGAGIKSGLGFGDQIQTKDENSIKEYVSNLYQKYVKNDKKKESWFTQQDFCDMVRQRQKKSKKTNCKSIGLLDVEQLKAKACDIHDQFDANKDGRVTLEEAAEGIKRKLGFGNDDEKDQKSLFQYAKSLYTKYMGSGKKDKIELSKDDFTKMIYEWKEQCAAKPNENNRNEEL